MGNDVDGVIGEDWGTPMVYDRSRGEKLFVRDHRAGEAADPSRKPSSNRLGQPSSVCLYTTLACGTSSLRGLTPTSSKYLDEQICFRTTDIDDFSL